MPLQERRRAMLAMISARRVVPIATLAQEFECSIDTVKRDLEALERRALVERVPGPVVVARQVAARD